MKKEYIVEAIGTFFLVLVVALSKEPLAIAGVFISLIYFGGYISGAHYNPAVTFALYLIKKIDKQNAIGYVISQFMGGFAASVVYSVLKKDFFVPSPNATVSIMEAALVEILFTFLLMTVVLHTAVSDKAKNNQYFGLAIGLVVLAGAISGGPISGGAFNPAVGVAPLLYNFTNISNHVPNVVLYLIAPTFGSVLAALLYKKKLS